MILKGSQRSGARNLALHLSSNENDHVEVHQVRGFVSDKLMGAFKESEALSKGTRCKQHLFSLSFNPPEGKSVTVEEFERAIDQAEAKLGLRGQPRAIVFHEKEGRRHAHAVWSRIDSDKMKAIPLPHYKRRLNTLSKQLFKDHGWRLPAGYIDKQLKDPRNFTLDEWQQAKRIKKDPRQIKQVFQRAWAKAKDTEKRNATFEALLHEHGYKLAQGNRRTIVAIDQHGEIYSVPRQLNIKTKEVKAILGNDLSNLPKADDLKYELEKAEAEKLMTFQQAALAKTEQQKQAYKDKLTALVQRQRQERKALKGHHAERQADEAQIRQARFRKGVKGLWDRLRGEYAKTAMQNELEAQQTKQRDETEKEKLIRKQLWERGQFKKEYAHTKQELKTLREQERKFATEFTNKKKWQKQFQRGYTVGKGF